MESDGRKHPAHQAVREAFNTPIIVFLTVITKDRKPILTDTETHMSLLNAWRTARTWLVGRYVIMPDHVHLFCAPAALVPEPLIKWASFWKSVSARKWPRRGEAPIWQRHFWDTQLRRGENYDGRVWYRALKTGRIRGS
jgi:REP element-mobilizing transposase RayT